MQSSILDYFAVCQTEADGGMSPNAQSRDSCPTSPDMPVMLGKVRKRENHAASSDYSQRLPKRRRRSTLITAPTYRQFQERYATDLSISEFLGLCAYLFVIVRWKYDISICAFDSFVYEYSRFKSARESVKDRSYHQWLLDEGLLAGPQSCATILCEQTLRAISDENQYTFGYVEESLEAIFQEQCLRQQQQKEVGVSMLSDLEPITENVCLKANSTQTGDVFQGRPSAHRSLDSSKKHPQERLSQSVHDQVNPVTVNVAPTTSLSVTSQYQSLAGSNIIDQPWHAEKELCKLLGVRDKQEFLTWLTQDWVIDVYEEYCVVELDIRRIREERIRDAGHTIPLAAKRSSAKFLINTAIISLQSSSSQHLKDHVDKSNWTANDHDIRFIVRLVQSGRRSSRWWENRSSDKHTEELCGIGYRLLCWLRYTHRLSTATSKSTQWQRAAASQWYTQLSDARSSRARSRNL